MIFDINQGFSCVLLCRTVILRLASLLVLMVSLYGMVVKDHDDFVDDCGNKRWETINDTSQAPIKVFFEFIRYGEQFIQIFCPKLSMYL